MDLKQLEYIVAIADEQSISKAAETLGYTQSGLTHMMRALEAENAELRPKALFADAVAASDGTCLVGELAKMIYQNGVRVGQNRLFGWMRRDGYLGKSGSHRNVPTQRAMEMGLFRIKERGFIRRGYKADLVLVRPEAPWTLRREDVVSKCGWSPLEGHTFHHKVLFTLVNGQLAFRQGHEVDDCRGEALQFEA